MDVVAKSVFFSEVKRLSQLSKTVLFSKQQLEEVDRVCAHLVILSNGKMAASGTLADVKSQVGAANALEIGLSNLTDEGGEFARRAIEGHLVGKVPLYKAQGSHGLLSYDESLPIG
jgi:ABC-type multidrug transport system ATPase subunit